MKKTFTLVVLFCLLATLGFGQLMDHEIHFKDGDTKETIPILNGNDQWGQIIVEKHEMDQYGNTPVGITIENTSPKYLFFLFCEKAFEDKLRNIKVQFDRNYYGNKYVEAPQGIDLRGSNLKIDYVGNDIRYSFPDIIVKEDQPYVCVLPIYAAVYKPCLFNKHYELFYPIEKKLIISVESKDNVYIQFERQCDSILTAFDNALDNEAFCTNKKHIDPIEKQLEPFTSYAADLRQQIYQEIRKNKWETTDPKYKRYNALRDRLESLSDAETALGSYEHDCGDAKMHRKTHSCKYCNGSSALDLEGIYDKLDRYYKELYTGTKTYAEIEKDVNLLYACCTASSCPKHASQWKKGNAYKQKIIGCYNKIKEYKNKP